jgi:hypothetical protein
VFFIAFFRLVSTCVSKARVYPSDPNLWVGTCPYLQRVDKPEKIAIEKLSSLEAGFSLIFSSKARVYPSDQCTGRHLSLLSNIGLARKKLVREKLSSLVAAFSLIFSSEPRAFPIEHLTMPSSMIRLLVLLAKFR